METLARHINASVEAEMSSFMNSSVHSLGVLRDVLQRLCREASCESALPKGKDIATKPFGFSEAVEFLAKQRDFK